MFIAALLFASSAPARTSVEEQRRWPVCQLEQVLSTPGHLRLFGKLVALSGAPVLTGRPMALRRGTHTLRCDPPGCRVVRQHFADQPQHLLDMALLVETSLSYKLLWADLKATLLPFLAQLPARSRLFLVALGESVPVPLGPLSPAAASAIVQQLEPSADVEIRLIEGIRAALAALRTADSRGCCRSTPCSS